MTGSDAMLCYLEGHDQAHTLKVTVLDVSRVAGGVGLADLRRAIEARIPSYPRFVQRLHRAPADLDHPWWVVHEDFDLDAHLSETTLAPPGDHRALDDVLSGLAQAPMDNTRPLWDATLVHGLEDGRVAVVLRIHHAITDGLGAINAFRAFTSTEPGGHIDPPVAHATPGVPSRAQMLVGGTIKRARTAVRVPAMIARGLGTSRRRAALHDQDPRVPKGRISGPFTSLNTRRLSHERRCATGRWPFSDIRSVAKAHDATVNHVLITMTAEAYRRELVRRGEEPPPDVVTAFGVVGDTSDSVRLWGNNITPANLPLFVEIEDPVERLQAIRDAAKPIIATLRERTIPHIGEAAQLAHPMIMTGLTAATAYSPKAFANVLTANVPGPAERRWVGDAEIVEFISYAILQGSAGPNVTMYSYAGTVYAGLLVDPSSLPDPRGFLDDMNEALTLLTKSVG